jgi:predicted AlkP superfamily phosphohydrolase/phosphomutase
MKSVKKVIAIGLDAAEPSLIERWMAEGYLKNLAALCAKGAYGRLSSSADWLVGSTWPTFYTGTLPETHGFYHYLQWRGDRMDYERPNPKWISANPFWRELGDSCKVIAIDIPLTFPPTPFNGIEISGWAAHDKIYPTSSYPKEKIDWVIKNFGKPPISDEVGGLQDMSELLKLRDELINSNNKEAELISSLLKSEEWDLFLCCFTSTHRGGHKFWTLQDTKPEITNVKGEFSEIQKIKFKNALRDIYQSCDEAIGRILDCLSEDVTILIFSLHGMGSNINLSDKMLPQMISNILNGKKKSAAHENKSIIKSIRNLIPLELRSNIRKLLPYWLQDKMTAYWRMGKIDWSQTKVFSLVADLQGYIRINLKGREREGIVREGDEYGQLCIQIREGLKTFKDADAMESIVESITTKDQLFNKDRGFDDLPDLLVNWKLKPAACYSKVVSADFGELEWPMPGLNPDGRSGNHRPQGFLIAKGEGFDANSSIDGRHIIDLAPTILYQLNIPIPQNMKGKIVGANECK